MRPLEVRLGGLGPEVAWMIQLKPWIFLHFVELAVRGRHDGMLQGPAAIDTKASRIGAGGVCDTRDGMEQSVACLVAVAASAAPAGPTVAPQAVWAVSAATRAR